MEDIRNNKRVVCLFLLQVDLKPLREATVAVAPPKITEKRKVEDADASKDLKKVSVALFAQTVFDEPFNRLQCSRVLEAVALKLGDEKRSSRFEDNIELQVIRRFQASSGTWVSSKKRRLIISSSRVRNRLFPRISIGSIRYSHRCCARVFRVI